MADATWHEHVTHRIDVPERIAEEVAKHLILPAKPHAPPRPFDPNQCAALAREHCAIKRFDDALSTYVPCDPQLTSSAVMTVVTTLRDDPEVELGAVEASAWFALLVAAPSGDLDPATVEAHFGEWETGRTLGVQDVIAGASAIPRYMFDSRPSAKLGWLCGAFLTPEELVEAGNTMDFVGYSATITQFLNGLRPVAPDSEVARIRTRAFSCLDPTQLKLRDIDALLAGTPSRELLDFVVASSPPRSAHYAPSAWAHLCLTDDPGLLVKRLTAKGANQAVTYAGLTRLLELGADARHVSKLIAAHHNHVNSGSRYRSTYSAEGVIANLHDPSVATVLYDFGKKHGVDSIKRILESEGANVVEGLMSLCARKGAKRDFALDALRGYIDRGHADLVRASVARAPTKIEAFLTEELFTTHDASAPQDPLDVMSDADLPKCLKELLDLPKTVALPFDVDVLPPLRLSGHDAVLPKHAVQGIVAATTLLPYPEYTSTKKTPKTTTRALKNLAAVRQALDPLSADACWLGAWKDHFIHARDTEKQRFFRTLSVFGHERSILLVGDLVGSTHKLLGHAEQGTRTASTGLFFTHEPLAYEQLTYAAKLVTSNQGWQGLIHFSRVVRKHFGDRKLPNSYVVSKVESTLLDEYYPRFGLNDRAERTLDYGDRSFDLFIDASCTLAVRDPKTGKKRASLPKPRKDEDLDVITHYIEDFARQKRRIKRLTRSIVKSLESAFRYMAQWTLEKYTTHFETSPLHRRICSMLLWGVYDADHRLVAAFRPDLEGEALDVNYEPVPLEDAMADGHTIGLVHPFDLDEARLTAWSQHFAEGEVLPPFPQLDRKRVSPDTWEAERAWHRTIPRFEDVSIALRKLSGWSADYTQKARNKPKAWMATRHSSMCFIAFVNESRTWNEGSGPDRGLFFMRGRPWMSTTSIIPWEDVPARVVSEALCDIERAYEKVHGKRKE